jgi:hypothetical protein
MFTLESNLDACTRRLDALIAKQLPYALSRALNDTAKDVQEAERKEMAQAFDRPTPFTLNAFFIKRASKTDLVAEVTSKDRQSAYLPMQAEGGVEQPLNQALLMPVHAGLNQYGNLPRGSVKRLLGKPGVFVARQRSSKTRHLTPGIYQRSELRGKAGKRIGASAGAVKTAGGARTDRLQLLIKFKPSAEVQPIFRFLPVAQEAAAKAMATHFAARVAEALATAR